MDLKRFTSLSLWIGAPIILLILLEVGYFFFMLPAANKIEKADAIIVFCGSQARIKAGYALNIIGWAKYLVLSPATEKQRQQFDRKYGLPPLEVNHIIESKARTTFENAYYVRKIIEEKGLKSIILVTSDYHMPRSYFLVKLLTITTGIKIFPYRVTKKNRNDTGNPSNGFRAKILYNEMFDLWGSLGEYIVYLFSGALPEKSLKTHPTVRSIKSFLLFDVKPGY